jgi:mxaJ protein
MARNLVGFPVYRGTGERRPIERLVAAVASGEVDVAVAWGPSAAWAARRERTPLRLTPVSPRIDLPFLPFVYDIAIGVRRGDTALRDLLDGALVRRRAEVDALLASYGVPRVP